MGGGGGGTVQSFPGSLIAGQTAFEQWSDYQQRFVPYQSKLLDTLKNNDMLNQDTGFGQNASNNAFTTGAQSYSMDLSRLGASLTPEQSASLGQSASLAQAGQNVAAANQAQLHTLSSNLGVMGGGLGAASQSITGPGSV